MEKGDELGEGENMKYKPEQMWAFAWSTGTPYITSTMWWTRKDVRAEVERAHGRPWKQIYRQGGRIIKVEVRAK